MNKKLILGIWCLLLVACHNDTKEAELVAYNYATALANYDIVDAYKFATLETQQTTLTQAESFLKYLDSNYIKQDTPAHIEILSSKKETDSTIIVSYHKTTPIKDLTGEIKVIHRNNIWIVDDALPIRNNRTKDNISIGKLPNGKQIISRSKKKTQL